MGQRILRHATLTTMSIITKTPPFAQIRSNYRVYILGALGLRKKPYGSSSWYLVIFYSPHLTNPPKMFRPIAFCRSCRNPSREPCLNMSGFKPYWVDFFCLVAFACIMGGLYLVPISQPDYRVFPVWRSSDGAVQAPAYISYPYVDQIITSPMAAALVLFVPMAVLVSFWFMFGDSADFVAATFGVLKALIAASVLTTLGRFQKLTHVFGDRRTFVQVIFKNSIGGFRPNFLDVCRPDLSSGLGQGYGKIFLPISTCLGMGKGEDEDQELIRYAYVDPVMKPRPLLARLPMIWKIRNLLCLHTHATVLTA